jgi:hydrogenase maturation factor
MKMDERRKRIERIAKIARGPLTDPRVLTSLKSARKHLNDAFEKSAKKGPMDPEAHIEAQKALKEVVTALHDATEVILASLEEMKEESEKGPVHLQEVRVKRPKKTRRKRA